VRYWETQPVGGALAPAKEIDQVRCVPLHKVREALTHDRDRCILERFDPGRTLKPVLVSNHVSARRARLRAQREPIDEGVVQA